MRLTNLIEEDLDKYFSSSKKAGKAAVVNSIIKTIENEGGRFLKQSRDGVWEEVDDSTALDKVGHDFRNRKPPTKPIEKAPAEKRSNVSSETASTKPTGLPSGGYMAVKRSKIDKDGNRAESPAVISDEGSETEKLLHTTQDYIATKKVGFDDLPITLEDLPHALETLWTSPGISEIGSPPAMNGRLPDFDSVTNELANFLRPLDWARD
jgi:hypothetical protein